MSSATALRRSVTTQILIARPIEDIWAALVDLGRYRDWNPYITRIEGAAFAGNTIEVHTRPGDDGAVRVSQVNVISVAPFCMRWQGGAADRSEFMCDHFFELESLAKDETLLRHYEHFSGTRLSEFGPAHEARVRKNFEQFNEALKAHCEAWA